MRTGFVKMANQATAPDAQMIIDNLTLIQDTLTIITDKLNALTAQSVISVQAGQATPRALTPGNRE